MTQKASAKNGTRPTALVVRGVEAIDVRVTGDFTGWGKEGIPLEHRGKGEWRADLALEPGTHEYRLLVDGEWRDHAEAPQRVPNPFGTHNCVITVE